MHRSPTTQKTTAASTPSSYSRPNTTPRPYAYTHTPAQALSIIRILLSHESLCTLAIPVCRSSIRSPRQSFRHKVALRHSYSTVGKARQLSSSISSEAPRQPDRSTGWAPAALVRDEAAENTCMCGARFECAGSGKP